MLNHSVVVDSIFVMAILTVLGYSVNDTIIIFDRIRENIIKYNEQVRKGTKKLYEIFDESVYQVMRRSLFTSISTLLVVICMYIFGNEVFKDFSFVIFV
jgi:preprotein translocase subunit SecF